MRARTKQAMFFLSVALAGAWFGTSHAPPPPPPPSLREQLSDMEMHGNVLAWDGKEAEAVATYQSALKLLDEQMEESNRELDTALAAHRAALKLLEAREKNDKEWEKQSSVIFSRIVTAQAAHESTESLNTSLRKPFREKIDSLNRKRLCARERN